MHDLLICHNYYALDPQGYPMVYTRPPCGNPVDNFPPVDNLWKTCGKHGGGGAGGAVRLLRYPLAYKKSLKLEKGMPGVYTSKLLFYLSFLRRGFKMTNI